MQIPGIDIMIFIHRADSLRIHEIPNLLQLRQENKIQFTMFEDLQEIRDKSFKTVLEKGGVVFVDDFVLLGIIPGKYVSSRDTI